MEILALEASTTSVKAMLCHTDTRSFEVLSREHSENADPGSRSAEEIYLSAMALGREIAAGKKVDMISLCGTWHNIMACSSAMEPLTPTYFWDFTGAAALCEELRRDEAYTHSFYHRTGCMVSSIYPAFKLKWLLRERPELRSARFLSLGAYFTYRMTGALVNSRCLLSGSGLLNTHTREYDTELFRELGLDAEQFCRLVEYDETFPLSAQAAGLLGLPSGIPVISANADGALNQTGAGALKDGVATLSIGTSGAIRLSTDRPAIPETPSTWCYLSPKG
ncbi:MAG: FGGY family carbohydrate kinase, partial [Oscillospiraceae bacterium]